MLGKGWDAFVCLRVSCVSPPLPPQDSRVLSTVCGPHMISAMEEPKLLLEEEKEFKRLYRLSVWWVSHRALLRRLGLGALAAFDAMLLLFALWTFLDSFAISYGDDQREVAKLAVFGQEDLRAYSKASAAAPIAQEAVRVFDIGGNRQDFYTQLVNPNEDWWVEFTSQFAFGNTLTPPSPGLLLPGESKPVIALAVESNGPVSGAELLLSNVIWHRLDAHEIPDYPTWQDDRLRMEITDAVFTNETGFEGKPFGRTTFQVFNNTAFGYYDPVFYVLLKRGASVVGVNRVTVASLGAGERAEIALNWFGILPSASAVEVVPDLALFDPRVYQQLQGTTGIDARTRAGSR